MVSAVVSIALSTLRLIFGDFVVTLRGDAPNGKNLTFKPGIWAGELYGVMIVVAASIVFLICELPPSCDAIAVSDTTNSPIKGDGTARQHKKVCFVKFAGEENKRDERGLELGLGLGLG